MVPKVRFELTHPCEYLGLSQTRLPFRHSGILCGPLDFSPEFHKEYRNHTSSTIVRGYWEAEGFLVLFTHKLPGSSDRIRTGDIHGDSVAGTASPLRSYICGSGNLLTAICLLNPPFGYNRISGPIFQSHLYCRRHFTGECTSTFVGCPYAFHK